MDDQQQYVIVGSGLAGIRAAETLREEHFRGTVVVLGAEDEPPYDRPPMSKGALLGNDEYESARLHERSWYTDQGIDLRLGAEVSAFDPSGRTVTLGSGDTLAYDRLLLATGSEPRRMGVPGADLDGVRYLRTMGDSKGLQEAFRRGGRVVIVGAGWIGLETAAAARHHGAEVTVVEPQPTALHAVVGPEVGQYFTDLHTSHGVRFRFGTVVEEIIGDGGRVTGVRLSDGDRVDADIVLVGIGVLPRTRLAEAAGLDVDNGVLCDQHLQTSAPGVYAAGDIARWFNPLLGYRLRVEHWANAQDSGPAAARSMLGQESVYDAVPFFFSDQYDIGLEYVGNVSPDRGYDQVVIRGKLADHAFMAFWLSGGLVQAGMHVNQWDTIDAVQDLIRAGAAVDAERLADPEVPLDQVRG